MKETRWGGPVLIHVTSPWLTDEGFGLNSILPAGQDRKLLGPFLPVPLRENVLSGGVCSELALYISIWILSL